MRNKILVLVLALVCLFAVSALADGTDYSSNLTSDNLKWIVGTAHGHTWEVTDGSSDRIAGTVYYKVYDFVAGNCTTGKSITLKCTNENCTSTQWVTGTCEGGLVKIPLEISAYYGKGHTRAGDDYKDHVDATCTSEGWAIYYCQNCKEDIKWTAKDHSDYAVKDHSNEVKGKTVTVTANCQTAGYTAKVCDTCNTEYELTYASTALGKHDYQDGVEIYEVYENCMQAGKAYKTRVCSVCHKADPEAPVVEIPKDKVTHDLKAFEGVNYEIPADAKTNADGLTYVKVLSAKEEDVIKATYHVTTDGSYVLKTGTISYTYVPNTCTEDGLITISCNLCKKGLQYAVKAPGHAIDFEGFEIDDCTETYTVAGKCNVCKENYQEVIGAYSKHEYAKDYTYRIQYQNNGATKVEFYAGYWVGSVFHRNAIVVNGVVVGNGQPAECLPYYEVYDCIHTMGKQGQWTCDQTKLVEVKAKADAKHEAPEKTTDYYKYEASTCTATGLAVYACVDCGETVSKTLKVKDHTVEKWSIDVEPTCAAAGKASALCKNCKAPQEKVLPALKHELVKSDSLSTAAVRCEDGEDVYTCENCDEVKKVVVPAQHSAADETKFTCSTYIAATCSKEGTMVFECNYCYRTVTVAIEKLPHKMEAPANIAVNIIDATCCMGAYYTKECTICHAKEPVFVSEALGHDLELTAAELKAITTAAINGTLDTTKYIVKGTFDCENGATGSKLCKEPYFKWTEKNGSWTQATTPSYCDFEWTFEIPALGHNWSAPLKNDAGEWYAECLRDNCVATKNVEVVKPEYKVELDGTQGKVTIKNELATPLTEAWVRISYGFELADGSYFAMTTCMPITFNEAGTAGTFSFFALNTSLESTGVNIMVVDQYDAMYKSIGELVGNNYGFGTF